MKQLTFWAMFAVIVTLLTSNIKLQSLVNRYEKDDARRTYIMAAYEAKNDSVIPTL